MKIFAFSIALLLIVSLQPQQTEAVARFFRIFVRLGYKLVKNSWYAKCNTRNVPATMKCPSVVFGIGLDKSMAISTARAFAELRGKGCGLYVGHCQVKKLKKKNDGMINENGTDCISSFWLIEL